jgi:glycosyltransferase involved in cell wall biosynthesis
MENNIKVSVCIVTYNHENYIKNCLDSLVNQNTNFDFEIIIGEDCSTDNTRTIIEQYQKKYPNIIKSIFHMTNIGAGKNYDATHEKAQGKYICHMDGDDYALAGKLQAQADFMDETPDCNICFHRVQLLYPNGELRDDLIEYEKIKDGFERKDLLQYMAVATHSSKMYRSCLRDFERPNFAITDFHINVEQIRDKKVYFVNDKVYGAYRVGVGISTNSRLLIQDMIVNSLNLFLKKYPKYKKEINSLYLLSFLADFKNRRNYKPYLYGFIKSFTFGSILNLIRTLEIRKMFRFPKVN